MRRGLNRDLGRALRNAAAGALQQAQGAEIRQGNDADAQAEAGVTDADGAWYVPGRLSQTSFDMFRLS
jgi:hypothetical protein